ncbi:MAG TPA: hypothetical protein VIO94_08625 [Phenylobacterium sp.]
MTQQTTDTPTEARSAKKRIPPLVWVIAAIFVAWLAVSLMQRDHEVVSPQGGTHPASQQSDATMPAAPATTDAPGTPASKVTNP